MVIKFYIKILCLCLLFSAGCTSSNEMDFEDSKDEIDSVEDENDGANEESLEEEGLEYPIFGETGEIALHEKVLSSEGLVLVNDAKADRVYLMEKDSASIVHEWNLQYGLGNDAELLPNGKLLVSMGYEPPAFSFGGYGGIIQILNSDSSVEWEFIYANEEHIIHHDVEMLPNGNVLAIVWDARSLENARDFGYKGEEEFIYSESLIEIDPKTDTIVWRWDSWDHLVQDFDSTKESFGIVSESPERININFVDDLRSEVEPDGDIMHANGIDYDKTNDIIYLSVNFFSEIWVIDHSTSTQEASSSVGGNYGKGGDLIYRFGNPNAYHNEFGERLFYNNHFPNLLEDDEPGKGNLLVFMNGNNEMMQSTVYELKMPPSLGLKSNFDNEPEIVWNFTDTNLYSSKVSGAVRLNNGNTLISSGDDGYWEVTENGELVWRFKGIGFYWRGYHYNLNDSALSGLKI